MTFNDTILQPPPSPATVNLPIPLPLVTPTQPSYSLNMSNMTRTTTTTSSSGGGGSGTVTFISSSTSPSVLQQHNMIIVGILIGLIVILCCVLGIVTIPPLWYYLRRTLPVSQKRIDRRYATIDGWLVRKVRWYETSNEWGAGEGITKPRVEREIQNHSMDRLISFWFSVCFLLCVVLRCDAYII